MSVVPIHEISRDEVKRYTDQVKSTAGVFSMIQESFSFQFATYQGIDDNDLQTLMKRAEDQDLKSHLRQTALVGGGGAKYSDHCVPGETGFKKTFVAFKKVNGKYDVVYCAATQIRQVNWARVGAAMGIGAVAGGALGGAALFIPGVNVAAVAAIAVGVAGGAVAGGAGAGVAAIIQKRDISNVVMGYIGKELSDRNLLQLV